MAFYLLHNYMDFIKENFIKFNYDVKAKLNDQFVTNIYFLYYNISTN